MEMTLNNLGNVFPMKMFMQDLGIKVISKNYYVSICAPASKSYFFCNISSHVIVIFHKSIL